MGLNPTARFSQRLAKPAPDRYKAFVLIRTQDHFEEPITQYMRRDFTVLKLEQTVGQALAAVRAGGVSEKIVYFYVVDAEGRLAGVVPTRRLLMSAPEEKIAAIMVENVVAVPNSATVLVACEFFILHRFLAFPVVDEARKLLGVVDVGLFTEEMFGVSERTAADDVFQLLGIHVAQVRRGSPWAGFRDRFPWLLCNIAGGMLCAFFASLYESLLDAAVVLAVFIPVVLALAESVGMQSMSITLQTLHTQRADPRSIARALRLEFFTALLLGLGSGLLVGVIVGVWKGQWPLALVVCGGICFSVVTACLLGVMLPSFVRRFRGDPKVAAGPIVLAVGDVATLLFYFNLAGMILG